MMNSTRSNEYNSVAKALHWSIALLIIFNYVLGLLLDETNMYTLHKQTGLLILLLVILRILWRTCCKYPAMSSELSATEQKIAKLGHILLYCLMLLIPIFGILLVQSHGYPLSVFGLFDLPTFIHTLPKAQSHQIKEFHGWLAQAIIILAALHMLAALKHQFIDKKGILLRMAPKHCKKS